MYTYVCVRMSLNKCVNVYFHTTFDICRKADGVVFVFDVTKPRSFTDVETIWMNAVDAPERYVRIY